MKSKLKEKAIKRFDSIVSDNNVTEKAEARFALKLIERWGVVLCESDGEDSSGRQKTRTLSGKEIVKKCFDVAKLAIQEIDKRDLWLDLENHDEARK